jgi:hypothetical protein
LRAQAKTASSSCPSRSVATVCPSPAGSVAVLGCSSLESTVWEATLA